MAVKAIASKIRELWGNTTRNMKRFVNCKFFYIDAIWAYKICIHACYD